LVEEELPDVDTKDRRFAYSDESDGVLVVDEEEDESYIVLLLLFNFVISSMGDVNM
jgi:hypothetical protein